MTCRPHVCDNRCTCPIHGTQLLYWPAGDEHACQVPDCEHAHGMGSRRIAAAPEPPPLHVDPLLIVPRGY